METQKADYYETLDIAKNASADEVKRAFRRLAMEFHPDRNSEAGAEARFKEINEAYEVLSDVERRANYDRFGHAGVDGSSRSRGFEGFGPLGSFGDIFDAFFGGSTQARRRAPTRGADIQVGVELSLQEAAFGIDHTITVNRTELCSRCEGLRAEPGTEPQSCSTCEGTGEVRRVQRSVFGQFINVTACDRCHGEGMTIPSPCSSCRGSGRERFSRTIDVKVPGGVDSGSQIRLSGEGELGSHGGPRGHLYLVITVRQHAFFERQEDDVYFRLNLKFTQTALGTEVEVPLLDGSHKLKIQAGTQSGDVISLRGKGVPHVRGGGRGDMHVQIQVETPKRLDSAQKKLLKQLAESLENDDEDEGKNLFGKVKGALR